MLDMLGVCFAFPTTVGMNRTNGQTNLKLGRVPHDRGDEPAVLELHEGDHQRSPRPWG